MKVKTTLLVLALLAGGLNAGAQTQERSFYIDYGQNNVANQGYRTEGADANGHYWNNIYGKGTGAPDKAYPQTINMVTSDNTATTCRLQLVSPVFTHQNSSRRQPVRSSRRSKQKHTPSLVAQRGTPNKPARRA